MPVPRDPTQQGSRQDKEEPETWVDLWCYSAIASNLGKYRYLSSSVFNRNGIVPIGTWDNSYYIASYGRYDVLTTSTRQRAIVRSNWIVIDTR